MMRIRWWAALPALVVLAGWPAAGAAGAAAAPAAPAAVQATNGYSSVSVSWEQPPGGPRPDHFRVYEGDAVVARNTTTQVTVTGLGFGSTHTFRITAVTASGRESAPSAPVTRHVWVPGMQPQCRPGPGPLTADAVTPTALTLHWPAGTPPRPVRVSIAGRDHLTGGSSLRVGGLQPGTTYAARIFPADCPAPAWPGTLAVTTPAGPGALPPAPTDLRVTASTATTIDLAWNPGGPPAQRWAVWSGGTLVSTVTGPSARLTGLWRGTARPLTVTALTADGAESTAPDEITARTQACAPVTPVPIGLRARPVLPSSAELTWVSTVEARSFTVYVDGTALTSTIVSSARITGLPPASRHRLTVVAHPADGCPASAPSRAVRLRTPDGPAARPGAPAGLRALGSSSPGDPQGTVRLAWDAPGTAPAGGYRIYAGAALIGTATGTAWAGQAPPATTQRVVLVAVDEAGVESAPSAPADVTASFYAPPVGQPGPLG